MLDDGLCVSFSLARDAVWSPQQQAQEWPEQKLIAPSALPDSTGTYIEPIAVHDHVGMRSHSLVDSEDLLPSDLPPFGRDPLAWPCLEKSAKDPTTIGMSNPVLTSRRQAGSLAQ